MKFQVTKRQIIKAIKTQPLKPGRWVHSSLYNLKFKNNVKCPVCAVGAILDMSVGAIFNRLDLICLALDLMTYTHLDNSNFYDGSHFNPRKQDHLIRKAKERLIEGTYLSALSGLYEGLSRIPGMKIKKGFSNAKLRGILIDFVRKNFPDKLTINTANRY
jgi:hypothetical protein